MIIKEYSNGNCRVVLEADGTKTRTWAGVPMPEFPESIDLKITERCDRDCPFCHEQSTKDGRHADVKIISRVTEGLPAGVEIAIGGGNPLEHPSLDEILKLFKERGLVSSITANARHFRESRHPISAWQQAGLLYGIGVSLANEAFPSDFIYRFYESAPDNLVYHVIAGVTDPMRLLVDHKGIDRLLVLGYKKYGRGEQYFAPTVEADLRAWKYWIGALMKYIPYVAFDNLALEQLGIRNLVPVKTWTKHYMGADGQFTMYADAVKDEYAVSSTSARKPFAGRAAAAVFKDLQ